MGSTRPCRVTSPVIPTTGRTGTPRSRLTKAVVMVTPAEGPSLGTAPAGTWTWNRLPAKSVRVDPELLGVRAHVGEGDLRRLLHDVAQLAREGEPLGAVGHAGLDEEDVAAGTGDGQAGDHAGHAGPVGRFEEEVRPSEPARARRDRRRRPAPCAHPRRASWPPCAAGARARARGCARRLPGCSRPRWRAARRR